MVLRIHNQYNLFLVQASYEHCLQSLDHLVQVYNHVTHCKSTLCEHAVLALRICHRLADLRRNMGSAPAYKLPDRARDKDGHRSDLPSGPSRSLDLSHCGRGRREQAQSGCTSHQDRTADLLPGRAHRNHHERELHLRQQDAPGHMS